MQSRNPFRRLYPERPLGRTALMGYARTAVFVLIALLFIFPWFLALSYGLLVFAVIVSYAYITERWLGIKRYGPGWTLGRWTLDQGILLLLVSVACFFLYNYTVGWTLMDARVLLYVTLPTVAVGLLTVALGGAAVQLRAEDQYQRIASRLQVPLLRAASVASEEELVAVHPDYEVDLSQVVGVQATAQGLRIRLREERHAPVPAREDFLRRLTA